jgi:hypothetical protein
VWTGHGLQVGNEAYLVPADGNANDLSSLIPTSWVKDLLDQCNCRFKALLVDACQAGDPNVTFKAGARLSMQPERFMRPHLADSSRGSVFAASSRANQRSWVQTDGKLSVWTANLIKALTNPALVGDDNVVSLLAVLAAAAAGTYEESLRTHHAEQTPYLFVRTEGDFPLGRVPPPAAHTDQRRIQTSSDPQTLLRVFQSRFDRSYGKALSTRQDTATERTLARDGLHHSRVLVIGPPDQQQRIAVSFSHLHGAVDLADLDGWKAYLAGPPAMVDAAGPLLLARGIRAADIHADVFFTPKRKAA